MVFGFLFVVVMFGVRIVWWIGLLMFLCGVKLKVWVNWENLFVDLRLRFWKYIVLCLFSNDLILLEVVSFLILEIILFIEEVWFVLLSE